MEKARGKITRSSGNVFRDLGFGREEAEHLIIRSGLMIKIEKLLKARGLTQSEAARIMLDIQAACALGTVRPTLELSCEAPLCSASSASTPC